MKGTVSAVCISEKKGTKKHPVPSVTLKENYGIIGDSHAANWHRQISLLADESVETMRALGMELNAGDFAENILTKGVVLKTLPIGTRIHIGEAILEVTQIGKECHSDCEIRRQTGQCVMPTEGIFAVVIQGGEIKPGDKIDTSLPLGGEGVADNLGVPEKPLLFGERRSRVARTRHTNRICLPSSANDDEVTDEGKTLPPHPVY